MNCARPGGSLDALTLPKIGPSAGSPDSSTPVAPSSLTRVRNGSKDDREAPEVLRDSTMRRPRSRANGRYSMSTCIGLPIEVATRS